MSAAIQFFVLVVAVIFAAAGQATPQTSARPATTVKPSPESTPEIPAAQSTPPKFTDEFVYAEDMIRIYSMSYESFDSPERPLGMTRVVFGRDAEGHQILQIAFTIENLSHRDFQLATKKPSFTLEEDTGPATLLYFCCLPHLGERMSAREKRNFVLFFKLSNWDSGEDLFFRIGDLWPISIAQVRFRRIRLQTD
jgi:hypothetical protein